MMNIKAKTILILFVTLIIGILIGALGNAFFSRNLLDKRIARIKTQQGFLERMDKIIQPQAGQKEVLNKILIKHHQEVHATSRRFRECMKSNFDSLLVELKPLLTQEQFERLSKRLKKRKPFPGKPGRRLEHRPEK